MDNHELENEIEMRMNPQDFSLSSRDLVDIMNAFDMNEHDVAFAYSKVVERKRQELKDETKDVMNYFREKGNYYPSFREFKKVFNQSTFVDDDILRDMHKKEISDKNQMSMFEIRQMIQEEFRTMSEEDEFEKDAAAITKNWGGEIKKSKDAQLSTDDFEDIVDAGAVARGEIESEFGEDEFSPMTDDEYKNIMKDLNEDIRDSFMNFSGDVPKIPGKNELRLVKNEIEDLSPNFTMKYDALKIRSKRLEVSYDVDSGVYKVINDSSGEQYYNKIKYPECKDCEFRDANDVVEFIRSFGSIKEIAIGPEGLFRLKDSQGNEIKRMALVKPANSEVDKKGRVKGFGDDGKGNMIVIVDYQWPLDLKYMAPKEMGEFREYPQDLVVQGMTEGLEEDRSNLRGVEVTYADGTVIPTSMAANLSDEDIHNYFKVGRMFNIGNVEDNMQAVKSVNIIRESASDGKKCSSCGEHEVRPVGAGDEIIDVCDNCGAQESGIKNENKMNELNENEELVLAKPGLHTAIMNYHNLGGSKEEVLAIVNTIFGLEEARGVSHSVKNTGDRNAKNDPKDHSHAPVTTLPESKTFDEKIKNLSEGKIKKGDLLKFINEQARKLADDIKREEK
jgi:hypothetical protein